MLTVAKGTEAKADDFAAQAERAKKKGWPVLQLKQIIIHNGPLRKHLLKC